MQHKPLQVSLYPEYNHILAANKDRRVNEQEKGEKHLIKVAHAIVTGDHRRHLELTAGEWDAPRAVTQDRMWERETKGPRVVAVGTGRKLQTQSETSI